MGGSTKRGLNARPWCASHTASPVKSLNYLAVTTGMLAALLYSTQDLPERSCRYSSPKCDPGGRYTPPIFFTPVIITATVA